MLSGRAFKPFSILSTIEGDLHWIPTIFIYKLYHSYLNMISIPRGCFNFSMIEIQQTTKKY